MYHLQGVPPGAAPSYHQPPPAQYPGYLPPPQAPSGQYAGYTAHQLTQQTQYGQYASSQQAQPPGVYPSSQPNQASGAYASNQQHHHQQQQVYGSNQPHQPGALPPLATTQSPVQSCYNCGRSDHWAQNCPEPRRAVPAGASNDSRPFKRQKTTGPIITRYPPPPHPNSVPSLQRGFTHPPAGHQAFPAPQGPPTPLSTNSQPYNSWKPPLNQYGSSTSWQASQQWTPSSVPTPTLSYGPQYASPVSINGNPQHQSILHSQPPSNPSQASPPRQNSYGSFGQAALPTLHSFDSSSRPQVSFKPSTRQSSSSDQLQTPGVSDDRVELVPEELQGLDFEEIKSQSGPIISHPANPVAQPLPADCATADAIGRLPIAASLPAGVSVSMYFRGLDEKEFERNIREKSEWSEVCHDPAFADIASACDAIPVSELIKRRHDEAFILDGSDNEAVENDYEADPYDQYSGDERRMHQRSYSERSATSDAAESPVRTSLSCTSNTKEPKHLAHSIETDLLHATPRETDDQRLSREQEDRLAALGVSGLPKPVQPSLRRTIAVTEPILASPFETLDLRRCSTSGDKTATHSEQRGSPVSGTFHYHSSDHSRDPSRELSHTNESPYQDGSPTRASPRPYFSRENSCQDRNGREPLPRYSSYDKHHPPPPPPPPARKQRYFDIPSNYRSSPTDNHYQESATNGHGEVTSLSNDMPSPSQPRSNPHVSRKRSYRHSSEESDGVPKRQEEENAQRRKRKHPKVADAYSRRW